MAYHHYVLNNESIISGRSVVINGGTFTQYNGGYGRKSSFDILKDAVAHTASHDSAARFDPPKCHTNTRLAVLEKIMNWVKSRDRETRDRFILWLTGAAGAGKSAIAQSFIELCLLHDGVLASFFFGRSDSSRNHAGSFIATLVYQIYHSIPAVQNEILSTIDADPLILTRSLEHQFTRLVAHPLSQMRLAWPLKSSRLVVIDGLDECLDSKVQQHILWVISNGIRKFNLPILFLIASRPEHEINVAFSSQEMKGLYTRLYLDDTYKPDQDIRKFLRDSFEEIRATHPFKSRIPASWPSPDHVESLVEKSSGQFIYAATVIQFIRSIRHQPHRRLDIVMNLRPLQGDMPFAQLDALYTEVLSSATEIDQVLYALSIYSHGVIGKSYFFDISEFMSLEEEELEILFCDLRALVSIEWVKSRYGESKPALRMLHASLHDFLLDPMRSKGFFLDIDSYRTQHVINILRYITSNKDSDWYIMEDRALAVGEFFENNFPLCHSSPELVDRASSFPITQVLGSLMDNGDRYMIFFVFFTLLPFFRRMARIDEHWLLIEERQHEALDQIFLSQMPAYYEDLNLTALLCFICHAGTGSLLPCFDTVYNGRRIFMEHSTDFTRTIVGGDRLLLRLINFTYVNTDKDQYRCCIIRFLREEKRSGRYAVRAEAYERAALSFILELERTKWTKEYRRVDYDEDWLSDQLTFADGVWRFVPNEKAMAYSEPSVACFLYLGYLLFFLPRSGKSVAIMRYCQDQSFLTDPMINALPKRTALARQAMKDYLERTDGINRSKG